jgi:parallel beta-helix repeat protein
MLQVPVISQTDLAGNTNVVAGAQATVYEEDGVTLFGQPIYAAPSGGATLTNPLIADSLGLLQAYCEIAQPCVLQIGSSTLKTSFTPDPRYVVTTYGDERPWVDPRDFGAQANGSFDDGPALRAAMAVVNAAGGGRIHLNKGSWTIKSTTGFACGAQISTDNVTIEGEGPETVMSNTVLLTYGFFMAINYSNIVIRNLRLNVTVAGSQAIYLDANPSASNWLLENIRVQADATTANGITLTNGGPGALNDVRLRNVDVRKAAGDTSGSVGIALAGSTTIGLAYYGHDLSGIYVEGYPYGIQTGTGIGFECRLTNFYFKSCPVYGAYLYHWGGAVIADGHAVSCLYGMYQDEASSNQYSVFSNVKFRNNSRVGLWGTQWTGTVINNCTFSGNGWSGLWMQSGSNVSVTGCTVIGNGGGSGSVDVGAQHGVLIDRLAEIGFSSATIFDTIENMTFSGCTIAENSGHGIYARGVRRGLTIAGCSITRNGQASATAATSTFGSIAFHNDTGGTNGLYLIVKGCTLGNVSDGTSALVTGKQQYGVVQAGGTWTGATIEACDIYDVETPISISSGSTNALGNLLVSGNTLALPAGYRWEGNVIRGGTLSTTPLWDNTRPRKIVAGARSNEVTVGLTQSEVLTVPTGAGNGKQALGPTYNNNIPTGLLIVEHLGSGQVAGFCLLGTSVTLLFGDTALWSVASANLKTAVLLDTSPTPDIYRIENRLASAASESYLCTHIGNGTGGSF